MYVDWFEERLQTFVDLLKFIAKDPCLLKMDVECMN